MKQTIMAIDVGSSSVSCVIAEVNDGIPKILGYGTSKARGTVKKTTVSSLEQTAQSIKEAVTEAKRISGAGPNKAIISTSGITIKSYDSSGIVMLQSGEIGIDEIRRVVRGALHNTETKISPEYEVVHILPYQFIIDGVEQVEDPNGMAGNNLKVMAHIVAAPKTVLENLRRAVKTAGIEVESIVLSSYASAIATLGEEEKELGVACVDIGGTLSDIMIYTGNSMCYNDVIRVGSNHVTNDIAVLLSTLPAYAESIKVSHLDITCKDDEITMLGIKNAERQLQIPVNRRILADVVCCRLREIFALVYKSIEESGYKDQIGAGIVFTGGLMKIAEIDSFIRACFCDQSVRIALPRELEGMPEELKDCAYSTVIGLILYASGNFTNYEIDSEARLRVRKSKFIQDDLLGEIHSKDDLSLNGGEIFKDQEELTQISTDYSPQKSWLDKLKDLF